MSNMASSLDNFQLYNNFYKLKTKIFKEVKNLKIKFKIASKREKPTLNKFF